MSAIAPPSWFLCRSSLSISFSAEASLCESRLFCTFKERLSGFFDADSGLRTIVPMPSNSPLPMLRSFESTMVRDFTKSRASSNSSNGCGTHASPSAITARIRFSLELYA